MGPGRAAGITDPRKLQLSSPPARHLPAQSKLTSECDCEALRVGFVSLIRAHHLGDACQVVLRHREGRGHRVRVQLAIALALEDWWLGRQGAEGQLDGSKQMGSKGYGLQ
jgi:hypothetical protein